MRIFLGALATLIAVQSNAATIEISSEVVTEWKLVYGQVETRDRIPARARIGGTIVSLDVTEGDMVAAGEPIAMIEDTKLAFQIDALDARLAALTSRLDTARAELQRGEQLVERGIVTAQRLDELQTAVSVIEGDISSLGAERLIAERQIEEGAVLAPKAGIVLTVPMSMGSFAAPGEAVAVIGGGGVYLRLSIPERHATDLAEGDTIEIGGAGDARQGRLAKLYPQIEAGRVQADVEVAGLAPDFVGRRVPVRLPVGTRETILIPQAALSRHGGLDFVTVETARGPAERVVVPGPAIERDGATWREILTGLGAGDRVVVSDE